MSDSFFAVTKIISDEEMRLLFAHKKSCGGANSVTECFSKVESDISDRCSQYTR